jgi:hypothetical protein
MSPAAVPGVKQAIGALTMQQAAGIAAEAMVLENAEAVRAHVRQRLCT